MLQGSQRKGQIAAHIDVLTVLPGIYPDYSTGIVQALHMFAPINLAEERVSISL